jgi:hypothetical protein
MKTNKVIFFLVFFSFFTLSACSDPQSLPQDPIKSQTGLIQVANTDIRPGSKGDRNLSAQVNGVIETPLELATEWFDASASFQTQAITPNYDFSHIQVQIAGENVPFQILKSELNADQTQLLISYQLSQAPVGQSQILQFYSEKTSFSLSHYLPTLSDGQIYTLPELTNIQTTAQVLLIEAEAKQTHRQVNELSNEEIDAIKNLEKTESLAKKLTEEIKKPTSRRKKIQDLSEVNDLISKNIIKLPLRQNTSPNDKKVTDDKKAADNKKATNNKKAADDKKTAKDKD